MLDQCSCYAFSRIYHGATGRIASLKKTTVQDLACWQKKIAMPHQGEPMKIAILKTEFVISDVFALIVILRESFSVIGS